MKQVISTFSALVLALASGLASGNCVSITDTTQADFQAGVATNLNLSVSPGNVLLTASGSGGGSLDQQNTSITTFGEIFSNTMWNAQTFTAGASGALTRVDINLFCNFCGSAPPTITVSIRATSGGLPSGSDLATSSTFMSNWGTGTSAFLTANFAAPATVSAGTQYAIVIRASAAYSAGQLAFSDSAISGTTGNDVYRGGALAFSSNSGGAWTVQQYGTSGSTADAGFKTYIGGGGSSYASAGDLISSAKDSAPPTGSTVNWSTISWTGSTPTSTQLRFQAAASSSSSGPFNFVGPDGTAATYFTSGASLDRFNGNRYLKYRAFLSTDNTSSTPTLNDASVCYSISTPPSADLSITNSDGVTSAAPGGSVTYSIKASNAGPSSVTNASVTDAFPAGLSCSWTCSGAAGGTCAPSGSGNINDATVDLTSGASVTYTATCSISASATGTLTNTASVAAPGGVTDPQTTNNSATDSDTLAVSTNVAITMSDNVDLVRIGDVVNYVIELTNSGSSTGSVKVTDTLPTKQLNPGSWVCTASGGASCGTAGGSGNLSDTATLPHGGKVDYVYTATVVSANTSGEVSNTVSGSMTSGGNQAQTNLSASDADIVVVFANNFEGDATQAAMAVTGSGGGASVSLELGVDAGLLNKVTVAPVTVASGQSASGKTLFSVQLMRIGADIAMRTLTTLDDGPFSDVSEWKVVDLKQHLINLGWRSASATGDDGFLSVGSSSTQMPLVANNSRENLTRLQVATENDIPWVVPVEP